MLNNYLKIGKKSASVMPYLVRVSETCIIGFMHSTADYGKTVILIIF